MIQKLPNVSSVIANFANRAHGRTDLLLTFGFALFGAGLGTYVVFKIGSLYFYQFFTPEVVMWACGRGMVHPQELSRPLVEFLLHRSAPSFDCSTLGEIKASGPPGLFLRTQLYLSWLVAGLWRWLGVKQTSLWPLAAALASAYVAGCYAFVRLFLGRLPAVAGTLILALSPIALSAVWNLRDYSKAPFFIWTLVLLFYAIRAEHFKASLLCAGGAGLLLGIGYGFRADLVILLPVGVLFLLFGAQHRRPFLSGRLLAPVLFALVFVSAAYPILRLGNQGGFGTLVMQGSTEPFRSFLGLHPAPYALGWAYSDELTLSAIAAEERPTDPNWDLMEGKALYSVSQAYVRSNRKLADWLFLFPADFAAQAIKSAAWIVGLPALLAPSRAHTDPTGAFWLLVPGHIRSFYATLGQAWLPIMGIAGLATLLLRIMARSPREAFCAALLFGAILTYPAIQFSVRHFFHLEFFWVLALLSLPAAIMDRRRLMPLMGRFVAMLGAFAAVCVCAYLALVVWQNSTLRQHIDHLLSLHREPIAAETSLASDGSVLLRIPVPEQHQQIISSPMDSMNARIPEFGIAWSARAEADRLLVDVGGPNCPTGDIELGLIYAKRSGVWQPMDSIIVLPRRVPGETVQALFPAFYRATQNLEAISLPAPHRDCTVRLARIVGNSRLPIVFSMVLKPNWRMDWLRKGVGTFGKSETGTIRRAPAN